VIVRAGRLTATCAGAGLAFTLDEAAQGALALGFTPGDGRRTCTVFGGVVSKDAPVMGSRPGQFNAKNAPAPASCPLP
jgi:hypothetical protein